MDSIYIYGGNYLRGETRIQGSKNAVLPILAASLLIRGTCVIKNCPRIADVYHMQNLLRGTGVSGILGGKYSYCKCLSCER